MNLETFLTSPVQDGNIRAENFEVNMCKAVHYTPLPYGGYYLFLEIQGFTFEERIYDYQGKFDTFLLEVEQYGKQNGWGVYVSDVYIPKNRLFLSGKGYTTLEQDTVSYYKVWRNTDMFIKRDDALFALQRKVGPPKAYPIKIRRGK